MATLDDQLIIAADGNQNLITELYPKDDDNIDEDADFAVRDSLAVEFKRNESAETAAEINLMAPFFDLTYDFVLRPL